jgi:uncharacterized protein (TIGR00255 family)
MTGFGVGTATGQGWKAEVTLRTLNNRFLSVHVHSFHDRPQLQVQVEETIKRSFNRGNVGVSICLERDLEADQTEVFSSSITERYLTGLRDIVNEFALPNPPTLSDLIAIGAVQESASEESDPSAVVGQALEQAIAAVTQTRVEEGKHLATEINNILERLTSLIAKVKNRLPEVQLKLRQRMQEKGNSLKVEVDPARLEMEIALLVERYDIEEEIARLQGHLTRAQSVLNSDQPVGKELDFLSQEMLREVNTLGSKSRDLEINGLVIDMKLAVNAFKEQVQNVE